MKMECHASFTQTVMPMLQILLQSVVVAAVVVLTVDKRNLMHRFLCFSASRGHRSVAAASLPSLLPQRWLPCCETSWCVGSCDGPDCRASKNTHTTFCAYCRDTVDCVRTFSDDVLYANFLFGAKPHLAHRKDYQMEFYITDTSLRYSAQ